MILHCTKKLAPKLSGVQSKPLQETSPLGSWHAHLYTIDRRQCVLFTHDETRYSIFIPGLVKSQFENFEACFKGMFLASLFLLGVPDHQLKRVELAMGGMQFDSGTNRSVLASMNQMKMMLDARVEEVQNVMDLDILEVSHWLSDQPFSSKLRPKYWWGVEEMKALVTSL